MGFCSDLEYREFLRSCPEFERMLVRSGIILLKYWFSVCDDEQERRFQRRAQRSQASAGSSATMDLKSREKWVEFSRAKDEMFFYTDIAEAPWYTVEADDKRRARLNCISHVLEQIDYHDVLPKPLKLPTRRAAAPYERPPRDRHAIVPDRF